MFETKIEMNSMSILNGREFNIPEFGFDISKSDLSAVKNPYGLILWTFIKTCHITESSFDNKVMDSVARIEKYRPKNYDEFLGCVRNLTDSNFGTTLLGISSIRIVNNTFWLGVWYYIEDPLRFKYKYEDQIYSIHPEILL